MITAERIKSLCCIPFLIFRHVDFYSLSGNDNESIWIKYEFSLTLIWNMLSSVECSNIFERYFWTFIFSTRKQSDCLISFRYFVNIFSLLPSGFQDAMRANQRLPISTKTIKNIVAFQLNKGYLFHKLRGCESSHLIYGWVTFVNKLFSSSAVPTQTGQDKACIRYHLVYFWNF